MPRNRNVARRPWLCHTAAFRSGETAPTCLMLADAAGDIAIAERAPGEPLFVRRGRGKVPLTNHFEGPLADDPKNRRVEAETSTLVRRRRLMKVSSS